MLVRMRQEHVHRGLAAWTSEDGCALGRLQGHGRGTCEAAQGNRSSAQESRERGFKKETRSSRKPSERGQKRRLLSEAKNVTFWKPENSLKCVFLSTFSYLTSSLRSWNPSRCVLLSGLFKHGFND